MASSHDVVLLSSDNEDQGTPEKYIRIVHHVIGRPSLDPATNAYWNHWSVKAETMYDEAQNGLEKPWFGTLILNPPSSQKKKMSIRPWWDRLWAHWARTEVDAAIYVIFNITHHVTSLQSSPMHPLQFLTMFPRERGCFLQRGANNGPPVPDKQPTHGNALVLLPTRRSPAAARAMVGRFLECAGDLETGGAVVRPV